MYSSHHFCEKWQFFLQGCLLESDLRCPENIITTRKQRRKQNCPQGILATFERKTWWRPAQLFHQKRSLPLASYIRKAARASCVWLLENNCENQTQWSNDKWICRLKRSPSLAKQLQKWKVCFRQNFYINMAAKKFQTQKQKHDVSIHVIITCPNYQIHKAYKNWTLK